MVFWWTGRGYLALPTTIGAVGVFGAVLTFIFGEAIFDRFRWLWAFAYWLAAAATWCVGSRINRRPINWRWGEKSIRRFIYRAPHRFISLPVETWAIPLLALGLVLGIWGLLPEPQILRPAAMRAIDAQHYWIAARFERREGWEADRYPFNLPVVRNVDELEFHPKVTFLVGENGSGKSTLIEALAVAWGFNAEGGSKNFSFGARPSHSNLHQFVRPVRSTKRARDGFFLRAESYFNVGTQIEALDEPPDGGPPIIGSYGGVSLHEQSHGESFFALLEHRFGGQGLYILDEPEAALSPNRQLSFLSRLHELVGQKSQFIIATHSPIILGYPDAWIYQTTSSGLERVEYEDTDHYQVTRNFLNRRETFLDVLLSDN